MEPFGTHVHMFKRIKFFSSVGAEFLLVQLFITQLLLVQRRKVCYKEEKKKFNIPKVTKRVVIFFFRMWFTDIGPTMCWGFFDVVLGLFGWVFLVIFFY